MTLECQDLITARHVPNSHGLVPGSCDQPLVVWRKCQAHDATTVAGIRTDFLARTEIPGTAANTRCGCQAVAPGIICDSGNLSRSANQLNQFLTGLRVDDLYCSVKETVGQSC